MSTYGNRQSEIGNRVSKARASEKGVRGTEAPNSRFQIPNSERGMVSIMVTLIMMLVITLIVLGFAQVVRRNTREQLDRQLSTQAYYAAESGVNDAYQAYFINKTVTDNDFANNPDFGTSCNAFTDFARTKDPSITPNLVSDGSVGYTCLLASNQNKTQVANIPYGVSNTVPLLATQAPGTLIFTWQPGETGGGASYTRCSGAFVPASTWTGQCPYGILRVDLYNAGAGASDAGAMANQNISLFMIPTPSGGGTTGVSFGDPTRSTYKVLAHCDANTCTATIGGIGGTSYYARLTSVYEGLGNVTIAAGDSGTKFTGQLMVDVTGKDQDELRRIQVRLQDTSQTGFPLPLDTISSGASVCKRFTIIGSGHTANDGKDINIPSELCANG